MKRKVLIIILCFLLVCSCKNNETNNTIKENNNTINDNTNNNGLYFNNFTSDIAYTQKNCASDSCQISYQTVYRKINVDTNISKLSDIINEINANVDKYYQKAIASKLSEDDKCGNYTENIYYSYNAYTYIFWHIDDEYIFLSQKIEENDLCLEIEKAVSMKTYIYDRKNDKMITQEEYLNNIGFTLEYFLKEINNSLKYNNYDKQIKSLDQIVIYKIEEDNNLYFTFLDSEINKYISLKAVYK